MEKRDTRERETCVDCGGTGILTIPAYGNAGEIVDEYQHPCACTIEEKETDY